MANTYRTVYVNKDGLSTFLGVGESYSGNAGEYQTTGATRMIEVDIPDLTKLPVLSTTASQILDDTTYLPGALSTATINQTGAFIEKIDVICKVTATGSSSTLNIGIMAIDRATAISGGDNGLIAAMPITSYLTAGDVNTVQLGSAGSTYAGSLMGTTLTQDALIVGSYSTAVFTAGAVAIRIYYSFITTAVT